MRGPHTKYRIKPRIIMNLFDCDIFQLTTTGMYISHLQIVPLVLYQFNCTSFLILILYETIYTNNIYIYTHIYVSSCIIIYIVYMYYHIYYIIIYIILSYILCIIIYIVYILCIIIYIMYYHIYCIYEKFVTVMTSSSRVVIKELAKFV